MPQIDDLENEMIANTLRTRNELEQALREPIDPERAKSICDELAEVGIAIERMYLPLETVADAKLCNKFGCSL
jgi:hypothetical protein